MFWVENNFIGLIKGKFKYQFDLKYRTQAYNSDAVGMNHTNLFANKSQQVIRTWVHYQYNSSIRISIAPIGWWGNWTVPNNNVKKFTPEFRISPQVSIMQKIGRVELTHRYRYEFRFIGNSDTINKISDCFNDDYYVFKDKNKKGRLRYFLRAIAPLNGKELKKGVFYLDLYDEVFFGIGRNVSSANLLDQNRAYIGIGYKFCDAFRLEIGYQNQASYKFNNANHNNVDRNNICQLFVIFDDFNSLFKKSKEDLK